MVTMTCADFAADITHAVEAYGFGMAVLLLLIGFVFSSLGYMLANRKTDDEPA